MASSPDSMLFGVLSLGGLGVVFVALRNIKTELRSLVLESDDYRDRTAKAVSEGNKDCAKQSDVVELRGRVKLLERLAKLPETTAIPRSEVHP